MSKQVVILGGGLAGLACGYELTKLGHQVTVLEREPQVGGMAASFVEDGPEYWTCDFGPHRFHTQDKHLMAHVREVLGDNLLMARRMSRIVLFGRFFDYPLSASNVLRNMPPHLLAKAFLDYFWVRIQDGLRLKTYSDDNFESWVTRRFGKTLYRVFFGQYTEKTWGVPPSQISANWASQRITLLSLWDTVKKTLFPNRSGAPRTLVSEFIYPKFGGIGAFSEAYADFIRRNGGKVLLRAPVVRILHEDHHVYSVEYGLHKRQRIEADEFISTIPVTAMVRAMYPHPPKDVVCHARALRHLSIVFIYLKLNRESVSPDSWVYLPEKNLTVHRIAEFKNFSPHCAPQDKTMVCAEITCHRGDKIWRTPPEELRAIAERDLIQVGLIEPGEILDFFVKRIPYAYPLYDLEYEGHLAPVERYIRDLHGIISTGRQGNFRYNNMDQSVEMGLKVAHQIHTGSRTGHEAIATGKEYFG